jgi:hypothetical protein
MHWRRAGNRDDCRTSLSAVIRPRWCDFLIFQFYPNSRLRRAALAAEKCVISCKVGEKLPARFPCKSGIHFANGFAMSSSRFFFPESQQQQCILAELSMYYACAKRSRRDRSSRLSLQQLLAFWTNSSLLSIPISKVATCAARSRRLSTLSHS